MFLVLRSDRAGTALRGFQVARSARRRVPYGHLVYETPPPTLIFLRGLLEYSSEFKALHHVCRGKNAGAQRVLLFRSSNPTRLMQSPTQEFSLIAGEIKELEHCVEHLKQHPSDPNWAARFPAAASLLGSRSTFPDQTVSWTYHLLNRLAELRASQNSYAPIFSLPNELLSKILLFAVKATDEYGQRELLVKLMQVAARWRANVLSYPALFTTITTNHLHWAYFCLSHSMASPIAVLSGWRPRLLGDTDLYTCIVNEMHRTYRLELLNVNDTTPMDQVGDWSLPAPILRRLILSNMDIPKSLFSGAAPALNVLNLSWCKFDVEMLFLANIRPYKVTILRPEPAFSVDALWKVLRRWRNLRSLTLQTCFTHELTSNAMSHDPVRLLQLRVIDIIEANCDTLALFLRKLIFSKGIDCRLKPQEGNLNGGSLLSLLQGTFNINGFMHSDIQIDTLKVSHIGDLSLTTTSSNQLGSGQLSSIELLWSGVTSNNLIQALGSVPLWGLKSLTLAAAGFISPPIFMTAFSQLSQIHTLTIETTSAFQSITTYIQHELVGVSAHLNARAQSAEHGFPFTFPALAVLVIYEPECTSDTREKFAILAENLLARRKMGVPLAHFRYVYSGAAPKFEPEQIRGLVDKFEKVQGNRERTLRW